MTKIIGTIITDCNDGNARTRQELRFNDLFGVKPTFLGVGSYDSIEAAGSLIDQLDVLNNFPSNTAEKDAILLLNVAPRGVDIKEKWDNGTPFCYFRIGKTLVVSSFEGHCLALAHDLGLIDSVELLDLPTVTAEAVKWGALTPAEAERINHTQFRSLEFLPLVAYWIWQGKSVPSQTHPLIGLPDTKSRVWHIDNFGNAKTTLKPEDVNFKPGKSITLANGERVTCYQRLADVPHDTPALVIGSSGYGPNRFLEVVIQRGNAAKRFSLEIGSRVFHPSDNLKQLPVTV